MDNLTTRQDWMIEFADLASEVSKKSVAIYLEKGIGSAFAYSDSLANPLLRHLSTCCIASAQTAMFIADRKAKERLERLVAQSIDFDSPECEIERARRLAG